MATNKPETSWEEQLRAECHKQGGSIRALAMRLGIDYAQLHRFMGAKQSLGLNQAEKVAKALGFELRKNSGKVAKANKLDS